MAALEEWAEWLKVEPAESAEWVVEAMAELAVMRRVLPASIFVGSFANPIRRWKHAAVLAILVRRFPMEWPHAMVRCAGRHVPARINSAMALVSPRVLRAPRIPLLGVRADSNLTPLPKKSFRPIKFRRRMREFKSIPRGPFMRPIRIGYHPFVSNTQATNPAIGSWKSWRMLQRSPMPESPARI